MERLPCLCVVLSLLGPLGGCVQISRYDDLHIGNDDLRAPIDLASHPHDLALTDGGYLDSMSAGDGAGPMDDLSMRDSGMPGDMSVSVDGAGDGPAPDLAVPTDGPAPDLAELPDLTLLPDLRVLDGAQPDLACAMACNAPPAAACVMGSIRTWDKNGTCTNGACVYTHSDANCANGCFNAACTAALSFFGNLSSYRAGMNVQVDTKNGMAAANVGVDIYSESFPQGATKEVHVLYTVNNNFANGMMVYDVPAAFFKLNGNNDQWLATIPGQAAGTHIYYYLRADGYSGASLYFSDFAKNWDYISN